MPSSRSLQRGTARYGFTLIEILVVLVIIVILVALTAAGYFYWIGSQQLRTSEATIRTVQKILQVHWNYVIEQAKKETPSASVAAMAGGDTARARVLWTKVRLMEAFPATYSEVNGSGDPKNPDPINSFLYVDAGTGAPAIEPNRQRYLVAYQRALNNGALVQDNSGSTTESSACLLMALSVGRGGASLSADDIARFVADTDNDGIKEVVDGFGKPLQFYRFAWGIAPLNGAPAGIQGLNPAPGDISNAATWSKNFKLADPLDSSGLLVTWPPVPPTAVVSYRQRYEALFHPITIANYPPAITNYNPAAAYYVIPVLMSAGPDGKLGLPLPRAATAAGGQFTVNGMTPTVQADEADNTYSFNLKGN